MLKKAFLTIDDSPSKDFLDKLAYLKQKQIPAIFFCIGQLLEQRPEMAIACIRSNYPIANHSYSHPHFSNISIAQCKEEILKTDQIIEALYEKAGIRRPGKWFRFPYGDKGDKKNGKTFSLFRRGNFNRKARIQIFLQSLGYTQPAWPTITYRFMQKAKLFDDIDWSWTFDVMEWAMQEDRPTQGLHSLSKIIKRMKKKRPQDCRGFLGFEKRWIASTSDEIILLHDHELSSPHFTTIINQLGQLPLQFESINPELEN